MRRYTAHVLLLWSSSGAAVWYLLCMGAQDAGSMEDSNRIAQARLACMLFPFLDDVEPIADAIAKKAAADAAAAAGRGARAAYYAAAAREFAGAEGCVDLTPAQLAARNVDNVLGRAGMHL